MYPLGIVSPDGDTSVRADLVDAFADHGQVAVVEADTTEDSPAETPTTYRTDGNGGWQATETGMDLSDVLDRLAPAHDYVILTGVPEADVPHLVVGDSDHEGDVLAAVSDPGAVDPTGVREALEGTTPHVTLESLTERAKEAPGADRAGAVATFTGRVRERDGPADTPTTHLEFETYEEVADDRMATLEAELGSREGVFAVRMHHRTGVIESGEDIVFVVVLAGHREEAFETVSDGIDRLKSEVPIFKKEVTVEDAFWRHER